MKAYVIGSSALFFWRQLPHPERFLAKRVKAPLLDCAQSACELDRVEFPSDAFGQQPIRIMTNCAQKRVLKNRFGYSVCSRALPEAAFCCVSDQLCVASPEFCLIQSAKTYSRIRLAELVMELCGKYSLVQDAQRGFISRSCALTTIDAIKTLLDEAHMTKRAYELVTALQFVAEDARSPTETREYLLLCLPKRYGGYGLPRPKLNARIDLDEYERREANRRYFECDMLWPDQKVVVEYDGHLDHESYAARVNDAIKRNILASKGYQVFTLTNGQIRDVYIFDRTARELASALGYRLRQFPQDWEAKRKTLRLELFRSFTEV